MEYPGSEKIEISLHAPVPVFLVGFERLVASNGQQKTCCRTDHPYNHSTDKGLNGRISNSYKGNLDQIQ